MEKGKSGKQFFSKKTDLPGNSREIATGRPLRKNREKGRAARQPRRSFPLISLRNQTMRGAGRWNSFA